MPFSDCVNYSDYFDHAGTPLPDTLIGAAGVRDVYVGGGIDIPKPVIIAPNSVLIRFYDDPSSDLGSWWTTPYELRMIIEHAGGAQRALEEGRDEGKGYLHATFAVLLSWTSPTNNNSFKPNFMPHFTVVQIKQKPFVAYYGDSKEAHSMGDPSLGLPKQRIKPQRIWDAKNKKRRFVRQIYLARPKQYISKYIERISIESKTSNDISMLESVLKNYPNQVLDFERN